MNCDTTNRSPFCASLAWPWLMPRAPIACPVVPVVRPCGRCGCSWSEHDRDECGAGCMSGHCECLGWRSTDSRVDDNGGLSTQAACSDVCTCGGNHADGASYYVSCVPSGRSKPVALLLGPYDSHSFALSMVGTARRLAERVDAKSHWYAYGTVALPSGEQDGVLMADLAEEGSEAERVRMMRAAVAKTEPSRARKTKEVSHG